MHLKRKGRKILIKKTITIYKKRVIAGQQLTLHYVLKLLVQLYNNKLKYIFQYLYIKCPTKMK